MIKRLCFIILTSLAFCCEELVEVEDISNETVSILAPVDDTVLENQTVNFVWQPIEYAESYQLQIAQPNFETALVIVTDTIISETSYTKTLEVSDYQWRVKAINSAYETPYTTQNLSIED